MSIAADPVGGVIIAACRDLVMSVSVIVLLATTAAGA
jgi:hypothetical protein